MTEEQAKEDGNRPARSSEEGRKAPSMEQGAKNVIANGRGDTARYLLSGNFKF